MGGTGAWFGEEDRRRIRRVLALGFLCLFGLLLLLGKVRVL